MVSKYRAKKVTIDGLTFDSKLEGGYYNYLKMLKRSGVIDEIETQFKIEFVLPTDIVCLLSIEESNSLLKFLKADLFATATQWLSVFFASRPELDIKVTSTGCISSPQPKFFERDCWILSNRSGKDNYLIREKDQKLCLMVGKKTFSYYADFLVDGKQVIDTKGVKTPIYNLKKNQDW